MIALVERWAHESHTFPLPVGECTITFEDVVIQLGLHVDKRPVIGYIGDIPPKNALVGSTLKLKWLKENMLTFLAEPTQQQLATHCREHILGLIGGMLVPNKSGDRVHLMYLLMSANLDWAGWYS